MGSYAGFMKWRLAAVQTCLAIVKTVDAHDAKEIWFPALVAIGFASMEDISKWMEQDVMERMKDEGRHWYDIRKSI